MKLFLETPTPQIIKGIVFLSVVKIFLEDFYRVYYWGNFSFASKENVPFSDFVLGRL